MKHFMIAALCLIVSVVASADRKLRYRVDVGKVESRSFPVPGGEFDFGFVMNQQLMLELVNSENFFAPFVVQNIGVALPSSLPEVSLVVPPTDVSGRLVPSCVINKAYAKLSGSVVSFELEGGKSIKVGYSSGAAYDPDWGVSAKLSVEKSKLWMNLFAVDPWTGEAFGASQGESVATYKSTEMEINFSGFAISPSYFHTSKLAQVTKNATSDALKNISKSMDDGRPSGRSPEWNTTVTLANDASIEIRAGAADGVKVGDRFAVYNMVHDWAGEECNSRYKPTTVRKAAIVEVYSVDRMHSKVRFIDADWDIYVGDKVMVEQLVEN